ncbi:hypothetical protein K1X76_02990 [bacterium]|nr:hypothetical protein [bacterium]
MKNLLITFLLIVLSQPAMAKIRLADEPSYREVLDSYLKEESMDYKAMREWDKKMNRSAWFPVLSVGYDHFLRETQAIAINDNISVSSSAVSVGPPDNNWDNSVYQADNIRVRAVWNLADLIFHDKTLSVSQEKRDLSRMRMSMSELLFKNYAERKQLVEKVAKAGSNNEACLKIELYNQKINALTHDAFKARWWRCGL